MSVYIIKNHKETALAIGNNGSGFTLVRSDWENMRLFGAGMLAIAKTTPTKPTTHGNLDECIRVCGGGARLVSVAFGSMLDDRHLLGFLEAATGMKIPGSLRHLKLANRKFTQWIASEVSADLKRPSVGLFERIYGFFQREPKSEAAFSATGSFTGDLLEVLKNPEKYLVTAMENYAKQVPTVRAVFAARDFGIAIGTAIETSLSFEGITSGLALTIEDLKKAEDAAKLYPCGNATDIRNMTPRGLGLSLYYAGVISNANMLVAKALSDVFLSIRKAARIYVSAKVVNLLGGALTQKLFSGSAGLGSMPKSKEEWIKDFARAASNEIQKHVEKVITAKIS